MITQRATALLLLLALAVGACSDDPTDPGANAPTRLNVMLTDAPGDVSAVWVEIVRVYLQGGDGPIDLLAEPTELIELTELVGTAVILAEDVDVAPGTYGQLRFVLGDAVLEADDGSVYVLGDAEHPDGLTATGQLQCPSCQQSGLKVILPSDEFELQGGETTVTLDFDVSQSFGHKAGNSGRWVMRPTIHGTWLAGGPSTGPGVSGQVTLASGVEIPSCPAGAPRGLEDFVPLATAVTLVDDAGLPLVRTGTTSSDGVFTLGPLAPDAYLLGYFGALELEGADLEFTASVTPAQALIGEVGVADVVYEITSAVCRVSGA